MPGTEIGKGWVKIYRKIMDSRGYFSEPFCRNMAWIDMILLANHSTGYYRCRGIKVEVNRGQIGYSIEELSKRWRWSRGKVERFMKELETDKQIVRQKNNITTLISILNYEEYQQGDKANSKANGQQTVKQTDTNKNDKNKKEEDSGELSPPLANEVLFKKQTADEFKKSLETYIPVYGREMIAAFENYWGEPNGNGKMRFQLEKTWETARRLAKWKRNEYGNKFSNNDKLALVRQIPSHRIDDSSAIAIIDSIQKNNNGHINSEQRKTIKAAETAFT